MSVLNRICLAIMLFALFLAPFAYSQEFKKGVEVRFYIKDWKTNHPFSNLPVKLEIVDEETHKITSVLRYPKELGEITYFLDYGNYTVSIELNNNSEYTDYSGFKEISIGVGDNIIFEDISIYPVGSVEGYVVTEDKKIVPFAFVDIKCADDRKFEFSNETDSFGYFNSNNLPLGKCTLFASKNDLVGKTEVMITHGELAKAEIITDEGISSTTEISIFAIMLVVGIGAYFLFGLKKRRDKTVSMQIQEKVKEEVKKELKQTARASKGQETKVKEPLVIDSPFLPDEHKEGIDNPRARDIILTLNEKEASIVDFLAKNANVSTQAKIRHELGIAKTSISRILESLESKKVIKIIKDGKLKKIILTDWFLGKE